jgi:hypothetical protein
MKFPDLVQKLLAWGSASQSKRPARQKSDAGGQTAAKIPLSAASADALRQARLNALTAEQDVADVSRAHLATLMASSPRHRMARLNDPELTPADRTELANSIRSVLPVSFRLRFPWWRPTGLVRGLQLAGGYNGIVALMVLVACVVAVTLAWRNTGARMVGSDDTWIVDWHLPDGTVLNGAWNARMPAVAMQAHNGTVVLRHWLNGRGYATTEVDERWLLEHSFTYLVAPIGAIGTTNPANR